MSGAVRYYTFVLETVFSLNEMETVVISANLNRRRYDHIRLSLVFNSLQFHQCLLRHISPKSPHSLVTPLFIF